jgi:hypothetical protein
MREIFGEGVFLYAMVPFPCCLKTGKNADAGMEKVGIRIMGRAGRPKKGARIFLLGERQEEIYP